MHAMQYFHQHEECHLYGNVPDLTAQNHKAEMVARAGMSIAVADLVQNPVKMK